jgi:hypothetical protein
MFYKLSAIYGKSTVLVPYEVFVREPLVRRGLCKFYKE